MSLADEWLAATAPRAPGRNAEFDAYRKENDGETTGALESFGRGALAGATLDFDDEIGGALKSAFGGRTYVEERDALRAKKAKAAADSPMSFMGGQLGGSLASLLVPGAAGAKLATSGGRVAQAAGFGAAAGLGASEADLTKGDVGGALADTATGAALGAAGGTLVEGAGAAIRGGKQALGGIAERLGARADAEAKAFARARLKAAEQAGGDAFTEAEIKFGPVVAKDEAAGIAAVRDPELARKAAADALKDEAITAFEKGTPGTSKVRAYGKEGVRKGGIEEVFSEDKALRAAQEKGPDEALDVIRNGGLKEWGSKLEDVYDRAAKASPGVQVKNVTAPLMKLAEEYGATTAGEPLAKVIEREAKKFFALHGRKDGSASMPLERLRKEYRGWQDEANKSVKITGEKSPRAQVAEEMANIMRTALHEEIERTGGAGLRKELQEANRKFSAYKSIEDILSEKSTREHGNAPTMGELLSPLKEIRQGIEQGAMNAGRGALAELKSIRLRSKANAQASATQDMGASAGVSTSTRALVGLARAVRSGIRGPELQRFAQDAIAVGAPRATVDKLVATANGGQQ